MLVTQMRLREMKKAVSTANGRSGHHAAGRVAVTVFKNDNGACYLPMVIYVARVAPLCD